jgi:uncharacterized protein (DUF433 family)
VVHTVANSDIALGEEGPFMTIEQVIADYPDLERDDLLAALEFGALTAGGHRVVPLAVA